METTNTDILIVGGGPTGLVLSNLLGSRGIDCIVVEKKSSTEKEPRAVSIDDESLRTLQAIGVVDRFLPLISRDYGSYYISPHKKIFAIIEPSRKKYGFEKRSGFDQPQLEALLFQNLKKFSSVKIFFDSRLEKILKGKRTSRAYISSNNKCKNIKAKYIIACDGGTSTVRKALGIELSGLSFSERWLIIDLFETENKFRHTQVHCDSRRPCITLPGPNGIRRYEFKLKKNECIKGTCDKAFVNKLFRDKGYEMNPKIRRKCVYTFSAVVAEKWRCSNIFLAGDAAHLVPPFAGQGMNSGIRDAHNLAWKLAYALKYDNRKILDSYEIERKNHVWQMINISILMGKILAPQNVLTGFITRFFFSLLSFYGPTRRYISQMKFKPPPYLKEGLIWKSCEKQDNRMIGRLFPQPLVEDVKGSQFPLDDLLRDESTIIMFSENPEKLVKDEMLENFKKRGVQIIGLTPEWMNPVVTNFTIVRDVSKLLSEKEFVTFLDKAFFIRPDRYVASIASIGSLSSFEHVTDTFQNKA